MNNNLAAHQKHFYNGTFNSVHSMEKKYTLKQFTGSEMIQYFDRQLRAAMLEHESQLNSMESGNA